MPPFQQGITAKQEVFYSWSFQSLSEWGSVSFMLISVCKPHPPMLLLGCGFDQHKNGMEWKVVGGVWQVSEG